MNRAAATLAHFENWAGNVTIHVDDLSGDFDEAEYARLMAEQGVHLKTTYSGMCG